MNMSPDDRNHSPRRRSCLRSCMNVLAAAALLGLVVCSGVAWYLDDRFDEVAAAVKADLDTRRAAAEHLGRIEELTVCWKETGEAQLTYDNVYILDVTASGGSNRLRVEIDRDDEDRITVRSAVVEQEDGPPIDLVKPPDDWNMAPPLADDTPFPLPPELEKLEDSDAPGIPQ